MSDAGSGGGSSPVQAGDPLAALDAVVSQAPLGVAVFDADGRYLYVNPTAAGLVGVASAEHVGRSVREVSPPLASQIEPLVQRALGGAAVADAEIVVPSDGGRTRTLIGSFIPYEGVRGHVVVGLFWEVTQRLEAEAARRAVDERFRELSDAAPVLMWTTDASGRCDWLSGGWSRFVGRTVDEQLGSGWLASVHVDDVPLALEAMRVALDAREPFDVEMRVRDASGAYRWLLDRGVPRSDADGEFAGYVGTCTDIHERRLAQDRMAALQRVTAAFAQTLTADQVAAAVVEHAIDATGARAGALCLVRIDGTIAVDRAAGYPDDVLAELGTFTPDAELPLAQAIRTGRPVFVESVDELPAEALQEFRAVAERLGTRSAVALPLVVEGRPVGGLGLNFEGVAAFDAAEREFLTAVATQCAGAVARADLYRAEREAREAAERTRGRLAFLAEAGRLLAGRMGRGDILRRVTELAAARLAPSVAFYLEQDGVLRRAAVVHLDPSGGLAPLLEPESVPVLADVPVARCFRSGRPEVLRATGRADDELRSAGLSGCVFAPVSSRSSTLGVLCVARFAGRPPFTDGDVDVTVELAARAGLAVENADLYEQEHRVAETLQRAVLPSRLPEIPGADVAARYLPASAGIEVGGDWYDAFDLRDGRVGIVVGDVAGHGLRAAAAMGQLRNALRAYAVDGDPPGVVLHRLGRLLRDEPEAPFATAIYGAYEPASGRVVLSNAGHPPPLLVAGGSPNHVAAATAPPLGVTEAPPAPDVELVLGPDDLLLLYTDGLVERRREHLDVGMARLVASLASHAADQPVALLCETVVADVLQGVPQEDDVCVLALRRS